MLLNFRQPDLVELDHFVSSSGVFRCSYGLHYVQGVTCYDICTSNRKTGEIVRLHFNKDNNLAPEASCKTKWEELKEGVDKVRRSGRPDDPTYLEGIEQWLDINQPNWRRRKPN